MRTTTILSLTDQCERNNGQSAGYYAAKVSVDGVMRPKKGFHDKSAHYKDAFEKCFIATRQLMIASGESPYYNIGKRDGSGFAASLFNIKSSAAHNKTLFDEQVEAKLKAKVASHSRQWCQEGLLKFEEGFRKACDTRFNNKNSGRVSLVTKRKTMDEELLDLVDMDESKHKRRKIESQPSLESAKHSQDPWEMEEVIAQGYIGIPSLFYRPQTVIQNFYLTTTDLVAPRFFSQPLPIPCAQDTPEKPLDDMRFDDQEMAVIETLTQMEFSKR